MTENILTPEDFKFEDINDFKWCMKCNGEVEFEWKGKSYGIGPDEGEKIAVYEANNFASEIIYDNADDALEYMLGEDKLRDVITEIYVVMRTI